MNQNEIDDMLSSNIMKWAISFYEITAIRAIMVCNNQGKSKTEIGHIFDTERNSILRKVSKFKEYMSEQAYKCVCSSIIDLCIDYKSGTINALNDDKGVLC